MKRTALGAGLTAVLLAGCAAPAPRTAEPGELTIVAAASLTASFTELAEAFAARHPETRLAPIWFDGSATLATQLLEGAPADVFASADEANMAKVEAELLGSPQVFATNTLALAVAPGNPLGLTGLVDLARESVLVVLCAPEVPCGAASHELLDLDGVVVTPASEEQSVTAVIGKVRSGEADAGLVYATDVAASGGAVEGVDLPGAELVVNRYPIGVLERSAHPDIARAFVDFVLSPDGQAILGRHGFGSP